MATLDLAGGHCYDGLARRARLAGALCDPAVPRLRKTYNVNVSMARLRVEQQGNLAVGAWETSSDT